MALKLATITASIAALDVDGLRVLDITAIPVSLDRTCPVLYPEPAQFVTNLTVRHNTFDSGALAPKTVEYDLTYTFAYEQVGTARNPLEVYANMVVMAFEILDAVIAADALTGAVDFQPAGSAFFGLVAAPDGIRYHGCQFKFHVKEFVN